MSWRRNSFPPTGFGTRLAALRHHAGLSKAVLARLSGVSAATISRIERTGMEPGWPVVVALARALGVTTDAFLPEGGTSGEES